jgi:preflagellin peptidase FlaK
MLGWLGAMDALTLLQLLAIAVTCFFFIVGSILDLKTREVDDRVWLAYAPIGLVLTTATVLLDQSRIILTIASAAVACVLAVALFYFGLFGGADAKAIMCLGVSMPLVPTGFPSLLGYAHPFFPIPVLVTGFICSALLAVWFGLKNLLAYSRLGSVMFQGLERESRWRKAVAMISGYRTGISRLRTVFYLYPMEEIVEAQDGARRSFKLFVGAEADRDKLVSEFSNAYSKLNLEGQVWVTPGLPLLVFITIGLVLTLIFGDVLFAGVFFLLGR